MILAIIPQINNFNRENYRTNQRKTPLTYVREDFLETER